MTMDLGSSNALEDLRIEVLNADGRVAYTTTLRSAGQRTLRQVLDLSELGAGLYVVRVINGTGSAARRLVLR
ncbi:MAG: T9SS type A sorting domain-containing protein [Flavobacteriales bacterium]|nr:T9SS type A sorting domain-containing protein [Flavobacteriales bacterium]